MLAATALVVAACGDDDETADAPTTDTPAASINDADEPDVVSDSAEEPDVDSDSADGASDTTDGDAQVASGEPIVIGVIASLTGPGSVIGVPFNDAHTLAVDSINAAGGVNGRPIELVIRDDETRPELAVQHFEGFARDGVTWVSGPNLTGTCYAVEPLSQRSELPTYCWSAAELPPEFPMYFSAYNNFTQVANGHMRDMQELGIESFALLNSTDASGQLYAATMSEAAAEAGIEITGSQEFETTDTDLTGLLAGLREGDPGAYFIGTSGAPAAIALRNAVDLEIEEPFFIGFGNASFVFADLVGSDIPDQTFVRVSKAAVGDAIADDDPMKPEVERYRTAWADAYGTPADPVSSATWDVAHIIAASIEATGGEDPQAMVEFLESFTYTGAMCEYEFSVDDHRGTDGECLVLTRFVGDGTFELVEF